MPITLIYLPTYNVLIFKDPWMYMVLVRFQSLTVCRNHGSGNPDSVGRTVEGFGSGTGLRGQFLVARDYPTARDVLCREPSTYLPFI